MRAAVLHGIGEHLGVETVADPVAGAGEVVVRLAAAALNHRDVWIRKGQYAGLKFPIILGSDGVGKVASVGPDVSPQWDDEHVIINPSLGWGDSEGSQNFGTFNILGLPHDGTFAEFVKVPAINIVPKPEYLTVEEAAALPLAGLTAFRAVKSRAKLEAGEKVLVTGAGGGAATFAIQIAGALGATVYVTSGAQSKIERAKLLGAIDGAIYKAPDWHTVLKEKAGGFDLIVDSSGGKDFAKLIELLNPGGRIVLYGATAGNPPGLDLRRVFWMQVSVLGTTMGSPSDFAAMIDLFATHQIRPTIDSTFPLEDADKALNRMEEGEQTGKIVVKIA